MSRLNKAFLLPILFFLFITEAFSQDASIDASIISVQHGRSTPKPPAVKEEVQSTLYVSSNPSGAKVYLDGTYKGTTPLTIEGISSGYHQIKVEKEHYRDETERIYFSGRSKRKFHAHLVQISGYLRVYSDPSGASLTVNGNSYYQGSLLELDEGAYTVRAKKFGYEEKSQTVYVSRRLTTTQTISLDRAIFRIESISSNRSKFNPNNTGSLASVKITAHVNAPENGIMTVRYAGGEEVFSTPVSFTTWTEQMYWTGTDNYGNIVQDGLYTIEIEAGGHKASCLVTVDSNLVYPDLSLTNGGTGIGSVASAESFPDDSSFLEIGAGIIMGNNIREIYQVPLSLGFLWSPSDCFELGLAFRPYLNGEDSVINFSSSVKLSFQTDLLNNATFCWGVFFRLGFATGPLYLPYGIDAGNGSGFGAVLGLKFNDMYIGGEASLIINPTSGLLTHSDDRIWKAGLALKSSLTTAAWAFLPP
ncbi:MAG: PEGA domain-containing protein [Treponema sp.]|nr:PEGA domain-containing protein [Treponema sp.]